MCMRELCAVWAKGRLMSATAGFTRTWRVGGFTATLTAPVPKPGAMASAVIEWEPAIPGRLSADELKQYRAGRDSALADLARDLGITVAVVDA